MSHVDGHLGSRACADCRLQREVAMEALDPLANPLKPEVTVGNPAACPWVKSRSVIPHGKTQDSILQVSGDQDAPGVSVIDAV